MPIDVEQIREIASDLDEFDKQLDLMKRRVKAARRDGENGVGFLVLSGVVDQHVYRAKSGRGPIEQGRDSGRVVQVGFVRVCLPAGAADRLNYIVGRAIPNVVVSQVSSSGTVTPSASAKTGDEPDTGDPHHADRPPESATPVQSAVQPPAALIPPDQVTPETVVKDTDLSWLDEFTRKAALARCGKLAWGQLSQEVPTAVPLFLVKGAKTTPEAVKAAIKAGTAAVSTAQTTSVVNQ